MFFPQAQGEAAKRNAPPHPAKQTLRSILFASFQHNVVQLWPYQGTEYVVGGQHYERIIPRKRIIRAVNDIGTCRNLSVLGIVPRVCAVQKFFFAPKSLSSWMDSIFRYSIRASTRLSLGTAMPSDDRLVDSTALSVVSRGFGLWKEREVSEGRSIALDAIARDSGLSTTTVRRFCVAPDTDVTASQLAAAAKLAVYFGVPLGDLVVVKPVRGSHGGKNGRGGAAAAGKDTGD